MDIATGNPLCYINISISYVGIYYLYYWHPGSERTIWSNLSLISLDFCFAVEILIEPKQINAR